jgi:hypothetical protein
MNFAEKFWFVLTLVAIGWYLTVTVYVAIRGAGDIRHMLARLAREAEADDAQATDD